MWICSLIEQRMLCGCGLISDVDLFGILLYDMSKGFEKTSKIFFVK